jgi:hypothetical protein
MLGTERSFLDQEFPGWPKHRGPVENGAHFTGPWDQRSALVVIKGPMTRSAMGDQGRYSKSMYFLSRSRTIPRNGRVAASP